MASLDENSHGNSLVGAEKFPAQHISSRAAGTAGPAPLWAWTCSHIANPERTRPQTAANLRPEAQAEGRERAREGCSRCQARELQHRMPRCVALRGLRALCGFRAVSGGEG